MTEAETKWKPYEEIEFHNKVIWRWVREGDEYVNRMTKEQMEVFKKFIEFFNSPKERRVRNE